MKKSRSRLLRAVTTEQTLPYSQNSFALYVRESPLKLPPSRHAKRLRLHRLQLRRCAGMARHMKYPHSPMRCVHISITAKYETHKSDRSPARIKQRGDTGVTTRRSQQ